MLLNNLIDLPGKEHDYAMLEENLNQNLVLHSGDLQTLHRIVDNLRLKIQYSAFQQGSKLFIKTFRIISPELIIA
ncbi:MAG: hypothetical protein JXB24_15350 [Bacteroidales bacterium]|nr:hypothetical protein [Bacteroidales bacterium]